jgi:DNA polymerase-1
MKKIALIDGYGFVFRAYHSVPNLTRPDGTNVGGVFGFTNMLIKLIASLNVSHIAVVFDSGGKTFRHNIYPQYKANRPPCPPELIPQFPIVRECVEALNIAVLEKIGFEADDIIATLAKKAEKQGFEVVIVSSDKDLMQLITENISMFDAMKNKTISFNEVQEKFMVSPDKVLEVLSLIGDSSDNIPGVKGIGPKTASELINQYDSIENLYQNIGQIKQEKKQKLLSENKENAYLSKQLIKLDDEVVLNIEIENLAVKNIDPHKLLSFLEIQGFKSLIYKVKKDFNINDNSYKLLENSLNSQDISNNIEKINIEYIKIIDAKTFDEIYQLALDNGSIVIDYLITDHKFNFVTLFPISDNQMNNKIYYLDLSKIVDISLTKTHDLFSFSNKNDDENQLNINYLNKILFDNSIRKIFYDGKKFLRYFYDYNRQEFGSNFDKKIIFDDLNLINYLINSAVHNSLLDLIRINLPTNFFENFNDDLINKIFDNFQENLFSDETQKINFFSKINLAIFELYKILAPKINDLKLYNCYLKNELPLLEVIANIEYNGIRINDEKLKKLSIEFKQKIDELSSQIYELAGETFNISSSKQLGEILFQKLQLESTKKSAKTKALSTNVKVLEELAFEGHIIAEKIIDFRKYTKLINTYCDSLPKQISSITNRVHTTLSSTSTLTGRLNSTQPNLQNIPIKTLDGKKIRHCFIASKNNVLISGDYSQIELRVLSHIAQIPELIEAFQHDKDIHKITASQIFGIDENLITEELRNKAKAINFGIIYGISAYGLARQLKIPNKVASDYIKSYFEKYQGIKEYMNSQIELAKKQGFVSTISNRKCFIKDINHSNPIIRQEAERQAINAPIQGSSADIIKRAMIKFNQKLIEKKSRAKLILQIHDELLIDCPTEEQNEISQLLKDCMENSYQISVNLKVDLNISEHWS